MACFAKHMASLLCCASSLATLTVFCNTVPGSNRSAIRPMVCASVEEIGAPDRMIFMA